MPKARKPALEAADLAVAQRHRAIVARVPPGGEAPARDAEPSGSRMRRAGVPPRELDLPSGSSFSAPVVAARGLGRAVVAVVRTASAAEPAE
jgi:hypothetical protein